MTVTLAWPSVLVISLLWGPDRRRQLVTFGAYLSVVVVLSLLSGLTAGDAAGLLAPITLWIIFASPGLVLLLFLNRAVRAVGPVLVVIAVAALVGANLALSLLATEAGATVAVELALAMGGGAATAFWVTAARGLGLGCAVGWGAAVALAEAHSAKRFGEQTLVTDAIWLLQTLVLANSLVIQIGAPGLIAAMLPLSIYKTITVVAHRRMARSLAGQAGRPLLFLRVFGFERRTVRLADLLAARWRYFGQVRLIACPDLAGRIVTPGNFLTFMRGRLGELFIRDHAGLDRRLAALDGARDPDARFRVENLFCSGDAWLEAVRRLMRDASAVVMDLRSFGADNEGCAFELQALLDSVPLPRIFLLVHGTTDLDLLRATLGQQWQRLDAASSNQRATRPRLHLLDVAGSEVAAVERLLREVVGEVAEPAVPNPQVATT